MAKYRIPITHLRIGDIIYFDNKDGAVNHIAVVSEKYKNNTIGILDASIGHGVSNRTIQIQKIGGHRHYIVDGQRYTLYGASNPVHDEAVRKGVAVVGANDKPTRCEVKANKINLKNYRNWKNFYVTSYIPGNGDPINCGGGGCSHTADGTLLINDYAGKLIACPIQFPFGTKIEIEGVGIMECKDRGGLIVMKDDMNSRCNDSTMNRLDVFVGLGEIVFGFASSKTYRARIVD